MAGIRSSAWRCIAVACAASLATGLACAQSPALDPSFGAGGRVWIGDGHSGYYPFPLNEGTSHVLATPDGGVLVLAAARLYRLDASGKVDTAYGYGAAGLVNGMLIDGLRIFETGKPALRPDGSVLVPVRFSAGPGWGATSRIAVIRLAPDGRLDRAYGADGIARAGQQNQGSTGSGRDFGIVGIAVEPEGRAVVALESHDGGIVLYRFLSTGVVDESFGPGGRRELGFRNVTGTATADPDGSFALLHHIGEFPARIGVLRFEPGGEVDLRFGQGRLVSHFPDLQQVFYGATVVAHDGHVTLATNYELVLERRDRDGRLVASFGLGGSVRWTSRDTFSTAMDGPPLALDAQGGTVLAHDAEVWRLDAVGRANAAYSNGGVAWLYEPPFGVFVQDIALAEDGSVYAIAGVPLSEDQMTHVGGVSSYFNTWRTAVYRLRGTWDADAPPGDTTVVEYFSARFGHYFITDRSDEQQALDAGGEWIRTGLSFAAWSTVSPGTPRMCRFFSDDRFAPKSTHFYARDPQECDAVRWDGKWRYEADMFAVRVPEGPGDLRRCPRTTVPLYRLFNNGAGGAPNHRYVTDAATRDAMLARGWIAEGDGPDRIFACVAAR